MKKKPPAAPKKRDPARTRARLLDAATEAFARRGFDGTSLSELVAASGVNRRMIYHYFGDKRGLYKAVFLEQWRQLAEALTEAVARARGADPLVAPLLGFFDFLDAHRAFVRLMMWEGLEGGEISRAIWGEAREPLFRELERSIAHAQQQGRLDPALDPAHLVVSFMGAVTFYFAYAPTLEQVFGQDALHPARKQRQRAQLRRLIESLLREDAAAAEGRGRAT